MDINQLLNSPLGLLIKNHAESEAESSKFSIDNFNINGKVLGSYQVVIKEINPNEDE